MRTPWDGAAVFVRGPVDHDGAALDVVAKAKGLHAPEACKVAHVYADPDVGCGYGVDLAGVSGATHRLCHFSTVPFVVKGQTLFEGSLIGFQGATGNATGEHTHWGVPIGDAEAVWRAAGVPEPWIQAGLVRAREERGIALLICVTLAILVGLLG